MGDEIVLENIKETLRLVGLGFALGLGFVGAVVIWSLILP